jgi:hypothetical protein
MAVAELAGTHITRTPDTKVTVTAKKTVEVHTGRTTTQHQAEAAPAATAAGAASGHKPESITAMNEALVKSVTKNEVLEIIRVLGYQAIPKNDEEFGEVIFSSSDGICWNIYLGHFGPFFEEIIITLFSTTKTTPFENINIWNLNNFSLASLEIDNETNQVLRKPDGTYSVAFSTRINLEGGVTIDHIHSRFYEWIREVTQLATLKDFIFLAPSKVIDCWG